MPKKLLFVDDELNILQGIKRMLRPYKNEWHVTIAESGEAALAMLEQESFDCIISDMRMPGMNGATLLTKVYERHPQVTRFILSGHADSDSIMQAIPVTHQFLAKPCSHEQLIDAIKRACELHNLIDDENLKSVIGKVDNLPGRPDVYAELARALADENTSLEDVGAIVEKDISISAKILQMVNSAFFGLPQNIASVKDAVSYLGLNIVKGLVLSEEVFNAFSNIKNINGFSIEEEYRESMLLANVAKKLVASKNLVDDVFMAAVLHAVGRLVVAEYETDKFKAVLSAQKSEAGLSLDEIERKHIGAPIPYIGAYLLGLWGLPYPVVEAVAHLRAPWNVQHDGFQALDALYVADRLIAAAKAEGEEQSNSINLDYLQQLEVSDQLPAWRSIVDECLNMGDSI